MPQGLLQTEMSVCEQFQGLEKLGKGNSIQYGASGRALGQLEVF